MAMVSYSGGGSYRSGGGGGGSTPKKPTTPIIPTAPAATPAQPAPQNTQPSNSQPHHKLLREISRFQLIYSLGGLVLGFSCNIGGVILFLRGVSGSSSWVASFIGAQSSITDTAPGAILFIVGLFMVWVTRYHIKIKE